MICNLNLNAIQSLSYDPYHKPLKEFYIQSRANPIHSPLLFHIKAVTHNS